MPRSSPSIVLPSASDARVPLRPDYGLILLRLGIILLVTVALLKPVIGPWAAAQSGLPPGNPFALPSLDSLTHSAPDMPETAASDPLAQAGETFDQGVALAASLAHTLYHTPLYHLLRLCVVLPLLLLVIEAVLNAGWLVVQQQRMRGTQIERARIRLPRAQTRSGGALPAGADLYLALHEAFSAQSRGYRAPPYLALTLTGAPDRPAHLGALVGGGTAAVRGTWLGAFRRALRAQDAEVVVDTAPDPLYTAIREGNEPQYLAWRELVLRLGPEHPLRLPDEAETDFLATLAAAVKPATQVTAAEVQMMLRPRPARTDGNARWRQFAARQVAVCRTRNRPEAARAMEEKLHEPLMYDVSLRLVAVGRSPTIARAALTEMTGALGQYTRQVVRRQQWRSPVGSTGMQRIDPRIVRVPVVRPMRTLAQVQAALHGTSERSAPAPAQADQSARSWRLPLRSPHTTPGALIGTLLLVMSGPVALWLLPRWLPMPALIWGGAWCLLLLLGTLRLGLAAHGALPVPARTRVLHRVPRAQPLPHVLLWLPAWRPAAILDAYECGALWHLPPPQLGELVEWLDCRRLPAPPEALVTPELADERIILGSITRDDGSVVPVGVPLADLTKVMHMIAGMGAGKSRLLINIIVQCFQRGVFVFDGKGDDQQGLTWAVRRLIPRDAESRLILIDLLDAEWPIGINPLAGVKMDEPGATDRVLGQVQAVFARLDPETWSRAPGMAQFLDQATLLVLAAERTPTLAHVAQALIDEAYRDRLLDDCTNREVLSYWRDIYPNTTSQQKGSRDALLRRFGQLLVPELTRFMTTQSQPLDLLQAINDRAIILAPIPHNQLGGLAAAVGMLLFQAWVRTAFARDGSVQTRALYPIVMDEFHILAENGATRDVEVALSQLRAQNMPLLLAHQSFSQVGDLKDLLQVNSYARVMPQTRMPDARDLASFFPNSPITEGDIIGQRPMEHQYVSLGGDPFSMEPLQWPDPVEQTVPRAPTRSWQQRLPADSSEHPIDQLLLRLVYGTHADARAVVAGLEELPEEQWTYLLARWDAIRHVQREYIDQHPACIPEALSRQRWLARLGYQTPRLLIDAAYGRIRRAIDPEQRTPDARMARRGPGASRNGTPPTHIECVQYRDHPDQEDHDIGVEEGFRIGNPYGRWS